VSIESKSYTEQVLGALKIFSDEPDDQSEFFNFGLYADQLCDLILKDIPDRSFAICLNGEWGSGKTSLLKRVFNMLKEQTDDRFKVLWFDAWQYERLDPVLALLQKIAILYDKKSSRLKEVMTSLTLVFSDVVLRKTTGLSVEDVQKHFETSVIEIETMAQTLQNMIGNEGKLVVFIDDLDRCSIDNTLDILESIKLLFNAKNTRFVVAADIKKLEIAWSLKHANTKDSSYEGCSI
jgi:predicted KAP-like P-loop ATPase